MGLDCRREVLGSELIPPSPFQMGTQGLAALPSGFPVQAVPPSKAGAPVPAVLLRWLLPPS